MFTPQNHIFHSAVNVYFYFLRLLFFWMFLFYVQKIIFLGFNASELGVIPREQIFTAFLQGFGSDLAATSYLMFLPLLFIATGMITNKQQLMQKLAVMTTYGLIAINLILFFAGVALYQNWGTKINTKAISLIAFPKEIFNIIFDRQNLLYFIALIIFTLSAVFVNKKMTGKPDIQKVSPFIAVIFFFFTTGLLLVGARGGLYKHPINKSRIFYSQHAVLNAAALNDFWNFISIISRPQVSENPYNFYSNDDASKFVGEQFTVHTDSTVRILTNEKPNIVLIALESFSADAIGCLGGEKDITPCFDSLAKHGLLFTDFYATGFRTDQGMVSMLNGFPAQPRTSIIKNFEKFDKLPNLITIMRNYGYHTSFYYGGDPTYANTESYLKVAGIHALHAENEIPHNRETDWGAYDEDVFRYMLDDLDFNPQPFFSMMFTLTNHEYFKADVEKIFKGNTENDLFHNTAHYTDKYLYEFLTNAGQHDWYKNTLFIITADHAHKHPLERTYNEAGRHHIPLLLFGHVLKEEFRGKTIQKTSSHLDIAATLFAQLGIKANTFPWSKNLMNPHSKGFAFYAFDDGFGCITDSTQVIYDHNVKSVIHHTAEFSGRDHQKTIRNGKAFLQMVFDKYIAL